MSLFRLILPVVWKINSRLGACRAEMGQVTIFRLHFFVVAKSKPFARPKVMPLSRNSPQFTLPVLSKGEKAILCFNIIDSHRNDMRESVVGETAQFLHKACGGSLAFHRIDVKVIQCIKCKCGFWTKMAGGKELHLEELHNFLRCIWALAPPHFMFEYSRGVHHIYCGILRDILGFTVHADRMHIVRRRCAFFYILPTIIRSRAHFPMMAQM